MQCCCGMFPASATTKSSEAGIKDLFHPMIIRHRTFNMFYQWMAVTLAYYGLTFSSTDLAGDPYSNFCSSVAIEIPGKFILAIYEKLPIVIFGKIMLINKIHLFLLTYRVSFLPLCYGLLGSTTYSCFLSNCFGDKLLSCRADVSCD